MIAEEANKYDCFNLEITTNTENWQQIISEVLMNNFNNVVIGAGTVLNMNHLLSAANAGARFALSPIKMTKEMLDYCNLNDIVSVPAAFTPSEVYEMISEGADVVKLFPAIDLPLRYMKDIMAPLGSIPLMVVGGINADNIKDYFKVGASYAGIGSGICDKAELREGNKQSLVRNLKKLSQLAK